VYIIIGAGTAEVWPGEIPRTDASVEQSAGMATELLPCHCDWSYHRNICV